jgi:predicted RNase H-like HicB family nuclease
MMERLLQLHIEKLPEGVYLATSDDLPGLVAQGRTITETLEIARDVARKLLEARMERDSLSNVLEPIADQFDYPLVVGGIG